MEISELSKTKASFYSSLSIKKNREEHRLFLIEGEKSILDSFDAFEPEVIAATAEWIERHPEECRLFEGFLKKSSKSLLGKISSLSTPPEIIGVFKIRDDQKELKIERDRLYLMLDSIQDPGNLGTIIRTADWFGIYDLIASSTTVDIYNSKTVQASMGSLKRVRVFYRDLNSMLEKNSSLPVYGATLEGENVFKSSLGKEGFIILGNEGNGISLELRKRITNPLLIPAVNPENHPDSLNVGVATGIILSCFKYPR